MRKLRSSSLTNTLMMAAMTAGLLGGWRTLQALRQSAVTAKVYNVASDRQLFIDNSMIANSQGITLTMNPAIKTNERNIVSEFPWEDFYVEASTVMKDKGIYKMWYDAASWAGSETPGGKMGRYQCYATSRDGIHWEKPKLGIVEFQGSKQNNIVLANSLGTVFLDPQNSDGNGYKYVGWWRDKQPSRGLWLFTSPDGIHWSHFLNHPILNKGEFDTQNEAFWDDGIYKWVAYVRRWAPLNSNSVDTAMTDAGLASHHSIRKVGRSETSDLAHWPEPNIVFSTDSKDTAVSDFYTPAVIKYPFAPHVYFMFPSAFYHYPQHEMDGPVDMEMATSRDGIHWNRIDRRPYVRLGLTGSEDGGSMYMAIGMLNKGDQIWMYYTGFDFTHGAYTHESLHKGVISRLVQRMDGFVSADAAYQGGELTTVPIRFSGQHLVLNLDTGALGFARVEIQDEQGRPLSGLGANDCERINGNFIRHEVKWNGNGGISALAGKVVRLRFVMRDTKLYSYQFTP